MKKYWKWNPALLLLLVTGLCITVAGIYFKAENLTSSGVQMGDFGNLTTPGTINGDGMIFCGVLIAGVGVAMAYNKLPSEE